MQIQKYSPKIALTETSHIPNQGKFYEDFEGLFKFDIAALFEGEIPILLRKLYMCITFYRGQ